MTTFPNSPKLLKGGIVLIDPERAQAQRIISLRYNPDSLSRTLQVEGPSEGVDRSEVVRLKGPAVETIKVDAQIDATDQMEIGDSTVGELGIYPQLAALKTTVYSTREQGSNNWMAKSGRAETMQSEALIISLRDERGEWH